MSVLVTGAAGFIGSHLVDRLLADGHEVVGLDNFDPFYERSVKERNLENARNHDRFRLIEGDIRDPGLAARLPGAIDGIVHLAARAGVRPSIRDPRGYVDVNLMGTMNVLEVARTLDCPWFVFGSSSSVYGDNDKVPFSEDDPVEEPISPYAATKRAGELLCRTAHHLHGLSVSCLRFFTVYGPRQRPDLAIHAFARRMMAGEPIPMFGDGTTARDYTYIDDILQGVVAAVDRVSTADPAVFDIVNLGESRTVRLSEMIATLAGALGVEPEIERLPRQPGDVERTWADVSRAERLLGYRPSTEFEEGIRRFVEWLRADAT